MSAFHVRPRRSAYNRNLIVRKISNSLGAAIRSPIATATSLDAFGPCSRSLEYRAALPSHDTRMRDQKYGSAYPARAPATASSRAASSEKNQTPLPPLRSVAYVRTFVSGKFERYGIEGALGSVRPE